MQKHQIEINLTRLKEIVGEYWDKENKDKYFRTYENKEGKSITVLTADLNMTEPKYAEKKDGSRIESATAVLHETGFAQVSEKVGEEWRNENFASVKRWIDKVDTTPPVDEGEKMFNELGSKDDGVINASDIPF